MALTDQHILKATYNIPTEEGCGYGAEVYIFHRSFCSSVLLPSRLCPHPLTCTFLPVTSFVFHDLGGRAMALIVSIKQKVNTV